MKTCKVHKILSVFAAGAAIIFWAANISGQSPIMPDKTVTPGMAAPVTAKDICVKGYSKLARDVPQSVKDRVYQNYGIENRKPREYEIDHLISLELGGSNDIGNLWPQSYITQPWNARVKDRLENKLHTMICKQNFDMKTAQREIAGDWIAAYKKYVQPLPDSVTDNAFLTGRRGTKPIPDEQPDNTSDSDLIGNKRSHIYYLPGCPGYERITAKNQIRFTTAKKARAAGYRLSLRCRQ